MAKTTKKTVAKSTTKKVAATKTTGKKVATKKKAVAKKAPVKKAPAKKTVAKKTAVRKKAVARKTTAKQGGMPDITARQRHEMIAEAAYLRAESVGFFSDEREDWAAAEAEIDARLRKAGIKVIA